MNAFQANLTTSVALMLGGVALIVLPTMVVGNELLILSAVALVVGAWFLAHRHGQLSGLVAASNGSAATSAPAAGVLPSSGANSGQAKMENRG
jgi:membrane-bound ClpP family serine protease